LVSEEGYPLDQQIAPASRRVSRVEESEVVGLLQEMRDRLLFLEQPGLPRPRGLALTLGEARALWTALHNILPEAQQIQNRLRERN
jgi:hypothetical protein